jgi:cytochrome c551
MSTRKGERAWIIGALGAVVALVVVLAFAVSYSPAEPTEEKSDLPVFGGTTEIPGATTQTVAPPPETAAEGGGAADAAAGKEVFASNCGSCHGADGTGGIGPNLTTLPAAADAGAVAKQVENGGGAMPAFKGRLSDQDIQNVAAYVSQELAQQ